MYNERLQQPKTTRNNKYIEFFPAEERKKSQPDMNYPMNYPNYPMNYPQSTRNIHEKSPSVPLYIENSSNIPKNESEIQKNEKNNVGNKGNNSYLFRLNRESPLKSIVKCGILDNRIYETDKLEHFDKYIKNDAFFPNKPLKDNRCGIALNNLYNNGYPNNVERVPYPVYASKNNTKKYNEVVFDKIVNSSPVIYEDLKNSSIAKWKKSIYY